MQERTYMRYYGLLAQRLCNISEDYQHMFDAVFIEKYQAIHRHEVNKIRNCAKLFAHLFYTDAVDWSCLFQLSLTEADTTSNGRIFIKILMQEIAGNLGIDNMVLKFKDMEKHLVNLFPKKSVDETRFAVNFYTSIGLGALTEQLRDHLEKAPKLEMEARYAELVRQAKELDEQLSSSDSSDSDISQDSKSSKSQSIEPERRELRVEPQVASV